MINLEIKNISKTYIQKIILKNVNLVCDKGMLYTILGPSGGGKTTLLKIITGIESPDSGKVLLQEEDISKKSTHLRKIGMVFQNFALFSHLNVYENIAYGLKAKKLSNKEIENKIFDGLKLISLDISFLKRNVNTLSGGEKQRVALLRTMLSQPNVILMDEPLSNVDANLRTILREDLRKLQKELNMTMLYVTHDKEEAFAISDKIAILLGGQIIQIGTPNEVYDEPKSTQVAKFLGSHQFISGTLIKKNYNQAEFKITENIRIISTKINNENINIGDEVLIGLKPERLSINSYNGKRISSAINGEITQVQILGPMIKYIVNIENNIKINILEKNNGSNISPKSNVNIKYKSDDIIYFKK